MEGWLDPSRILQKKGGGYEKVAIWGLKRVKMMNFAIFHAQKVCLLNTISYFCSVKIKYCFIMNEMNILRILAKGQITSLSSGFSLGGKPFSIFIRSKQPTLSTNMVVNCKLICDKEAGAFPCALGDWTPGAIAEISPNAIDLTEFDVYWGAGESV